MVVEIMKTMLWLLLGGFLGICICRKRYDYLAVATVAWILVLGIILNA